MIDVLIYGGVLLVLLLLGAVFFGAPYVPTLRRDVQRLFEHIDSDDVLVDLGSGDGRLVRAAAAKGVRAYGIELSPILVVISWLSMGRARRLGSIRWGNYWRMNLPDDTTVVFVFLAGSYMDKLRKYMESEAQRLGRPLKLASYGFKLPGYEPVQTDGALLLYVVKP